jgi:hypothetical protein
MTDGRQTETVTAADGGTDITQAFRRSPGEIFTQSCGICFGKSADKGDSFVVQQKFIAFKTGRDIPFSGGGNDQIFFLIIPAHENGGIADAEKGVLNVDGTVNVGSLRVFNGGEVNVAGTVVADQTDNPNGGYVVTDLWGEGSKLNINGGTFNVKDDMRVQAGAELNVNSGKLNVDWWHKENGWDVKLVIRFTGKVAV